MRRRLGNRRTGQRIRCSAARRLRRPACGAGHRTGGCQCRQRRVRRWPGYRARHVTLAFSFHASLEAGENQASTGEDAVQLTVHAARSQFDVVFITGLEGPVPHENSLSKPPASKSSALCTWRCRAANGCILRWRRAACCTARPDTPCAQGFSMNSRRAREMADAARRALRPPAWPRGACVSAWQGLRSRVPVYSRPHSVTSAVKVGRQEFRIGTGVRHARFGEGTVLLVAAAACPGADSVPRRGQDSGAGIAQLEIIT